MIEIKRLNKYKLINFKKIINSDIEGEIFVTNGKVITNVSDASSFTEIDCKKGIVTPGFIDVQVNGLGECNFWDVDNLTFEKIDLLRKELVKCGVVAFCPTIITAPKDKILKTIDYINSYLKTAHKPIGARIIGIHLEGVFITNYGVHKKEYSLSKLNIEDISPFIQENVVMFTYAPELDKDGAVKKYLASKNILASIGHSLANYSQGIEAIKKHGYDVVTHMFNVLKGVEGFSHRVKEKCNLTLLEEKLNNNNRIDPINDGIVLSLLQEPNVLCMVIADGIHVCKEALEFLIKKKGKEYVSLVSDQVSSIFYNEMALKGMLGGGQSTLDMCIKNLIKWKICSVDDALYMASVPIAKRLKVVQDMGFGTVTKGNPANLVIWNTEKNTVLGTIIGENVFLNR
ncbi:MAG: amidohydrolase family protein [Candidatus Melainabacteria bacterium]|nr:amidohydrolase family protein [Candidatus Melainabacteria bacterium]